MQQASLFRAGSSGTCFTPPQPSGSVASRLLLTSISLNQEHLAGSRALEPWREGGPPSAGDCQHHSLRGAVGPPRWLPPRCPGRCADPQARCSWVWCAVRTGPWIPSGPRPGLGLSGVCFPSDLVQVLVSPPRSPLGSHLSREFEPALVPCAVAPGVCATPFPDPCSQHRPPLGSSGRRWPGLTGSAHPWRLCISGARLPSPNRDQVPGTA